MTHTPTNATITVERKDTPVEGLTDVSVLILPARPEIVALRDIPATKAAEVFFNEVVDIREQDVIVESSVSYRVVGVSHYRTPRAAHTEVLAETVWGAS